MNIITYLIACLLAIVASTATAAELKWVGVRSPCKQSAEDGLNEKQLGKKIGRFITLPDKQAWGNVIANVHNRFPNSKPWATWAVGNLKGATPLIDEVHEEYLSYMDEQGVEIYLEVWPSGADVLQLIDTTLAKFAKHKCVAGFGVDLEYVKKAVDDATAKAWDERIKSVKPNYRLFLKHWEISHFPPAYRGAKNDMIFINTSSEAPMADLDKEFATFAEHFAPCACAFQIGYPADEDAMDGSNKSGWWTLKDSIKEWGDDLLSRIKSPTQEIGILWVCVKSGKTYNARWDLTTERSGQ
jgi:hypothetical protein